MSDSDKPVYEPLDESTTEESEPQGSSSLALTRLPRISMQVSLFVQSILHFLASRLEDNNEDYTHVYKQACQYLTNLGLIDESWKMTELEGARLQYKNVVLQLVSESPKRAPSFSLSLQSYLSQYSVEFEEIAQIGEGAFGKVFHVKHKLDGREYAVKKIPILSLEVESVKACITEVKTFASLDHANIVQYRAAWFEYGTPQEISKSAWNEPKIFFADSGSSYTVSVKATDRGSSETGLVDEKSLAVAKKIDDKLSPNNVFEHSLDRASTKPTRVHSRRSLPTNKALVPVLHNGSQRRNQCWATLYIQMALCHGTLGHWLKQRNYSNMVGPSMFTGNQFIYQVLVQILRGLKYIHSKDVVHHDIKPSNIFITVMDNSLLIQLGDFGLACPLQKSHRGFAGGTPLYAAPEQIHGQCDKKSDMYSLGIVLYELFEDFGTDMERYHRIAELRCRTESPMPVELSLSNIVSALVRHEPSERPDASTLLEKLEDYATADVEYLRAIIRDQNREIRRLKKLLSVNGISDD